MSTQTEVMTWMREKRLQDALATPGNEGQRENIETVLHMIRSGELAPLWAEHDLYFCNGLLLGSTLPSNWRSLPGRVWHEPECGLAHEFAAFEEARLAAIAPQIITWTTKGRGNNNRSHHAIDNDPASDNNSHSDNNRSFNNNRNRRGGHQKSGRGGNKSKHWAPHTDSAF